MQFTSLITCPSCHHEFSLSDEFQKDIEKKMIQDMKKAEDTWAKEREKLEQEKQSIEEKSKAVYEKTLHEEKVKMWQVAQEKANEKLQSEFSLKMKDLEEQNKEHKEKLDNAQKRELEFLKKERELEEQKKNIELEMQRKMNEERIALESQIKKESEESHRLKLMEKEKQIEQMKKSLDDAQRKAEQGSMQIQGDVKENDLRDMLKAHFPLDEIADVPTGVKGADIIQTVKNAMGQKSGVILWESKNTKNWVEGWLQKLKDDQAALGADISIIVSKTLPEGVEQYEYRNGVWVVSYGFALSVVSFLRFHIIEMSNTKQSLQGQDEKMTVLYTYLSSPQFKNRIENIVSAFESMKSDLEKEKRAMQTIWSRREKELERVVLNTSGFYGDLQGITGNVIPEVESLSLPGEFDEKGGNSLFL